MKIMRRFLLFPALLACRFSSHGTATGQPWPWLSRCPAHSSSPYPGHLPFPRNGKRKDCFLVGLWIGGILYVSGIAGGITAMYAMEIVSSDILPAATNLALSMLWTR